jgi:ubiquinone/menaquinone biosynthesis C-methylase UbiE
MENIDNATLKAKVKQHWEDETCGIRYGESTDRQAYFREISESRYELEPYIPPFADFAGAKGKRMLEIGVGAGSDFENWCRHADHASGIDLTERAISLTRERLQLDGFSPEKYSLQTADAENLPFADESFDMIYSWGVLLCTPDTQRAFQEAYRVLKPGGMIKAMVYHIHSWGALQLYLLHGLARGKLTTTMKQVMYEHLESPGTKGYTLAEARQLLEASGFEQIKVWTKLSLGDMLTLKLSKKYQSPIYKVISSLYPRWLVRLMGDKYGMNLMMIGIKPDRAGSLSHSMNGDSAK